MPARCIPTRVSIPPTACPICAAASINALTRADQIHHSEGKNGMNWFAPLDRRCRSRVRRHPERFRADEGHDRGRRGLRSFRRSAVVGQEVRTPRRQGAGADRGGDSEAGCGASGGGRAGRAHADHGAHRCQQRAPADQRHRSARPRLPHRRAHCGRLLRHPRRLGFGHRARPGLCAVCRSDLVRDFGART